MSDTFLGLDIGTSSVKAVLLDGAQAVVASASIPLTVSRPQPLWSEQDPQDWWQATQAAVAELRRAAPEAWRGLAAIGLSGQQHGATLLDAAGRVLRPAILWNDGRSGAECLELMRRVPDFSRRAGSIAMPGFTSPKLLWVQHHEPAVFAAVDRVLLPKDYVRWRMTGAFVSDMSDASGMAWLNIAARDWDDTLLAASELSRANMPDLVEGSAPSATLSPALAAEWGIRPVPVAGGGGDNAAAAVGVGAVRGGEGVLSLGTSGVIFAVTEHVIAAPERTLHAFCHALPGRWHGMSVHLSAAASLEWLAGIAGLAGDIGALLSRTQAWATAEARRHAPIFLPYLSGERTPHNDPEASGLFAGLRAQHGIEAMTYAVLEGVAFAFRDGLDVLTEADARPTSCLLVGGGARSAFWGQILADTLSLELAVAEGAEAGAAFGAGRLAMLAAGHAEAAVCTRPPIRQTFSPAAAPDPARLHRFRGLYAADLALRQSAAHGAAA